MSLKQLLKEEYSLQQEAVRIRRLIYEQENSPAISAELLKKLQTIEEELFNKEKEREQAQADDPKLNGTIINSTKSSLLMGPETTGLEAEFYLNLEYVPTSIVHLFDSMETPLISCKVKNTSNRTRRLRVTSFVEGYSAQAVDTLEIRQNEAPEFKHLPVFFLDKIRNINELTKAAVNVMVEDLDSQAGQFNGKIELHKTKSVWLLARTTAPMSVINPQTGKKVDMTQYLGAFVTPNAPEVMSFLRAASDLSPQTEFVGYQGDKNNLDIVLAQVKAIYDALKNTANIHYVNSVLANNPQEGTISQRVRLPRESLKDKQANCIDGTLLFASLLEAISMNPAIVTVPGHAFVGWETWENSGAYNYVETTLIAKSDFTAARKEAEEMYKTYDELEKMGVTGRLYRWSLRDLRSVKRITPME
jgi:hypothetical protein